MNKKTKFNLLYSMIRMRMVEERISSEYSNQQMRCPVHLSVGQEAISSGICLNLKDKDQVFSAHRSHFHYLAKGGNLKQMISELFGKETGCAGGKGGSMHLIDIKAGLIAAVPIVGSTIPIGVGLAWANKLNRSNKVVVIFFGEGATEEGVFYESINFAALHNLPILFVCENNYYSVYSNIKNRQPTNRKISNVSKSMGVESYRMNGNKVEEIFTKTQKMIHSIRKKNKPILIELSTYRVLEHCGPNNDDHLNYRNKEELNTWLNNCPIEKYKKQLLKQKVLSKEELKKVYLKIDKEISQSFDFAKKSKFPNKDKLFKYIYAD
ncbi:thiamine pyrophosphate-dependent dehydrogenase E1 component subunit alpha [Pelagibacteraceae bacterium]|nr:thiamine pyrophosphate-dependent dehydrogenase E1 component subunit alpha [Pelagibacteraceae bacterium]